MKKILVIFIIISFYGCSGYKPILNSKDINFYIKQIDLNWAQEDIEDLKI